MPRFSLKRVITPSSDQARARGTIVLAELHLINISDHASLQIALQIHFEDPGNTAPKPHNFQSSTSRSNVVVEGRHDRISW